MSVLADLAGFVKFHYFLDDTVPKNTSEVSKQISYIKVLKPSAHICTESKKH
jgi:hypothetical protein